MSELEKTIKDAWVGHIAAHSGPITPSIARQITGVVHRERPALSQATSAQAPETRDFQKLEQYIARVEPQEFTRDVSYQLYYVTECLIWLWKRLPREILIKDENKSEVDDEIDRLLSVLNAGATKEQLSAAEQLALPNKAQGDRATPNGVEAIVKRAEIGGGRIQEGRVRGFSHEPPPPPPGWPGE